MNAYLAIDFGGTKTIVAIVGGGEILSSVQFNTPAQSAPEEYFTLCKNEFNKLMRRGNGINITAIGATVPGPVVGGKLIVSQVPAWRDVDINAHLSNIMPGVPVGCLNDVNACALAEILYGGAGEYDNFLWSTLSTGCGGALVINRKVVPGARGFAGEYGHITVEHQSPRICSCGNPGCLEAHASGRAIAAQLGELLINHPGSSLSRYINDNNLAPDAKALALAANVGIPEAADMWRTAGMYIARAWAAAINVADPQAIFVGGGMLPALPYMLPAMRETLNSSVLNKCDIEILPTKLGYNAGVFGAAAAAQLGAVK